MRVRLEADDVREETTEFERYLVAIRLGDTPVPIPNTMVKP